MGLCSSKVSHKVIKVTPVPPNETGGLDQLPGGADGERLKHGEPLEISKPRRSDLPPLKERHVAGVLPSHQQVPTAISFDINPVDGETSIIKKHPPRRFQGLEPINSCTVITSEKLLEKRAANARKVQAQEIQAEIAKQFSRRRQQIEKMQYEKIRQEEIIRRHDQAELMINCQKETQK
ncbi:factor associated with metabolism and energy-like isoform X2 [Mobula hypostoma]|uniref:factor associated with metabolism and energy-like isoform X2 n=1 Tax=Mobula hypostoma TaxID=723540 RepID=UPI002FC2F2B2